MKIKKKYLGTVFIFMIILIVCVVVIIKIIVNDNKMDSKKTYVYVQDEESLYILGEEENKISSDCNIIDYSSELSGYITLDNEKTLYLINRKGEKNKIASDIYSEDYVKVVNGNIYYTTSDEDLFIKRESEEKLKIASDVREFKVEGKNVIFKNNNSELYIVDNKNVKLKIASNVNDYSFSKDFKYCVYASDGNLYVADLNKNIKEKFSEQKFGWFEFYNKDSFIYREDYDYNSQSSDLYYKKIDSDKIKIASGVTQGFVSKGNIIYLDNDNTLYSMNPKTQKNSKILENVREIKKDVNGNVSCVDKDNVLYLLNQDYSKVRVNQDIVKYDLTVDNIVSINKEYDLFLGGKKIASGVKDYSVNGNDVVFINDSNQIFMVTNGNDPKLLISDADQYNKVNVNNYKIFTNYMDKNELIGTWRGVIDSKDSKYGTTLFVQFTQNKVEEIYMSGNIKEDEYAVSEYGVDNIKLITNEKRNMCFKNNGEEYEFQNDNYTVKLEKVSEEEYERYKNIADRTQYIRYDYLEYGIFSREVKLEGKRLYEYVGMYSLSDKIYFDDDINIYEEDEFGKLITAKTLEQKFNESRNEEDNKRFYTIEEAFKLVGPGYSGSGFTLLEDSISLEDINGRQCWRFKYISTKTGKVQSYLFFDAYTGEYVTGESKESIGEVWSNQYFGY